MKLRQIECLCAIVDADFHISRAAKNLHATQPAVSRQLILLEQELGLDLLQRHRGRLVGLTEVGERTLAWGRRALQCFENIRGLSLEQRGGETGGTITIATSPTHTRHILLPVIRAFSRRYPRVRVVMQQATFDEAVDMLAGGKATLAVMSARPLVNRDMVTVAFRSSEILLITPVGHPILKTKRVTMAALTRYPFVLTSPSPMADQVHERLRQEKLQLDVVVRGINSEMTKEFVEAGLGIGVIPAFTYSVLWRSM